MVGRERAERAEEAAVFGYLQKIVRAAISIPLYQTPNPIYRWREVRAGRATWAFWAMVGSILRERPF